MLKDAIYVCAAMLLAASSAVSQQASPTPAPTAAPIKAEVTVTANVVESRIDETPASVIALTADDVATTASPVIDDVLRQTAGFSIFRRSSSRTANPTTQGVSLRGMGSSGASRSVVLFDEIPLNDPFGGWVQWNRVSPIEVDRIEVRRGGASSLYGDSSLSGTINIIPVRNRDRHTFSADLSGGTLHTLLGSGFAGVSAGKWAFDAMATAFQTRGYVPVEESSRGPVDSPAGVRSWNFAGRSEYRFSERSRMFIRPTYFGEVRANGTGAQTNRTHIRQLAIGGDHPTAGSHAFRAAWRAFGGTQTFDQVFTSVNSTRTLETLTRVQRVPAQTMGLSAHASGVFGAHTLLVGGDLRNVRGSSDELAYTAGRPTSQVDGGGRERSGGIFAQDFARIGDRLVIAGSIRYDRWSNYAGFTATRTIPAGVYSQVLYPARSEEKVSPQLSVLIRVADKLSFYAGASRSFRAPTLNELYRSFRVGNVLTLANDRLTAETADTFEGGVMTSVSKLRLRVNGFYSSVNQPVTNVTLTSTPSLITRQRQNAGRSASRGLEAEADVSFRRFSVTAGYLFVDSYIAEFPGNPALVGLATPQVPRHQFTYQFRYAGPSSWTLALQGRAASSQFDDDQNLYVLEAYFQQDVFVSHRVNEHIEIYGAAENILNSRYSIARTPVRSVSAPLSFRLGIRWK